MGRDKALLPHPRGGCWLEQALGLLAGLGVPITLLSGWPRHLAIGAAMAPALAASGVELELLQEPEPREGPLRALDRLMAHHPDQRLFLCPVDMPDLTLASLETLMAVAATEPALIHLAHDGQRLQPLLGIYPADACRCARLSEAVAKGERRLQGWLQTESCRPVPLDAATLRNRNRPTDL